MPAPQTYDGGMSARAVALLSAAVALAAGCGDEDVARTGYVKKNLALLEVVAPFPDSKRLRVVSSPYKENDTPDARIAGYGTTRVHALPSGTRPGAIIGFYRRTLPQRGWRVLDLSEAPSISLRRRDVYLHIVAGLGAVDVEVDHNCYKGRSYPSCFGP